MRLLHLERDDDVSGVSGIGRVAEGVEFPDGTVVLQWNTVVKSLVVYQSVEDLTHIVGHGGRTRVVFDDVELVQEYEVWSEGFVATGESGTAVFHGRVSARTFNEACDKLAANDATFAQCYTPKTLAFWGCRLFPTEKEARASYG